MADQQKIEDLIRARSAAAVDGDLELLQQLLTPDFKYINKWGDVIPRAAYFERKSEKSSDSYWISQDIDEIEINLLSGDVALANFRVLDHQMFEGNEMKDYVRTSYVCIKRNNEWFLHFGQTSPIEPE